MMKKQIFILALCSVGVVPFVFISQWAGYVGVSGFIYSAGYRTSLMALIVREGLPILLVFIVMLTHRTFFRSRCFLAIIVFVFLVIFELIRASINTDTHNVFVIACITGGRFCMFFLLPYAIFVFFKEMPQDQIDSRLYCLLKLVAAILLLNIAVSLFPIKLNWAYDTALFGIRAIGITNGPNSSGALMGIGALLILFYRRFRRVWLIACVFFFGSLLTGSRTSVIGTLVVLLAGMLIIPHKSKSQIFLIVVLLVLLPYVIVNLNNFTRVRWNNWEKTASTASAKSATPMTPTTITSQIIKLYKEDKIDGGSMRIRFEFFNRFFREMNTQQLLLGYGLGYGTNLAAREGVFIDPYKPDISITDSLLTLMLVNFGIIGTILFCIIVTYFIVNLVSLWPGIVFITYYFLFGLTQNLIESYPTTVLFGVLLGCYGVYRYNSMVRGCASGQEQ